jgi:hypothetical protein
MVDPIASFGLRGATDEELGGALGRCFAEFAAWHGQATIVANFAQDSRIGGIQDVLADKISQSLDLCEAQKLIIGVPATMKGRKEAVHVLGERQLRIADQGVKVSAIVMLHNSCERFLWRLVRFGLVGNREKVLTWIGERKITIKTLIGEGIDDSFDFQIEKWWNDLERHTLADKWDKLSGLVGFPSKLNDDQWHFDRRMIVRFDDVRNNAVHSDAKEVRAFDFAEFATQLWRAHLVWVTHVASLYKLRIPADSLLHGS